jgi:sulfofructose kinase
VIRHAEYPRVVCVGLATLDTIAAVLRHPEADERVVASELVVAGGGPAATAAVTLARLGVATAFVGAVGDDEAGLAIREGLAAEGIDVSELGVRPGARSPQSVVLVSGQSRAIAAHSGTVGPLELTERALALCREADWVHVDHVGYPARPPARRLSVDGGNPIAGLDLAGVALYAPTEAMLESRFGTAADALAAGAGLVVVTRGARGALAYTVEGDVLEVPSPPIDVVSTLGAGDVFHGALLAGLIHERPLRDALELACECAALSCRALDGRSAVPSNDLAETGA